MNKVNIFLITGLLFSLSICLLSCGKNGGYGNGEVENTSQTETEDTAIVIPIEPEEEAGEVTETEMEAGEVTETEMDVGGTQTENGDTEVDSSFYMTEITDELFSRIYGKSYKEDCTVPREDLRYIHVLHKDKEGKVHEGEMVCNAYIAEDLLVIFRELYDESYPIEKMRLVDEYNADDNASMADNNSSCFNFRFIARTRKVSKHGLGLAVDINTRYNPYISKSDGKWYVEPENGQAYTDRSKDFDYKIERGDLCFRLFSEHGFEWGGDWKNSKDYQHFEIPSSVTGRLYPG